MSPQITIRLMEENDIEQVFCIEQECFSTPWSKKSFQDALQYKTYRFWVAEEQGEVLGYIGLITTGVEADITNVAVSARNQRRGIGQQLVSNILQDAMELEVETIFLEVRKSNEKAKKLYEKMGFISIAIRENYYQNPREDAIIMSADLSTRKRK